MIGHANTQAVPKDLAVGIRTNQGVVYLHDVLHITTPKGRKIENAKIVRIDGWSSFPVKVQYRADDGKLRDDAFNLDDCSWCHVAGQIGNKVH